MSHPVYALNLFNISNRDEYLAYSRRSAKEVQAHGGRVLALGKFRDVVVGDIAPRTALILVEWASQEAFDSYCHDPALADLHPHRVNGTSDYVWHLFDKLEDLRPLLHLMPRYQSETDGLIEPRDRQYGDYNTMVVAESRGHYPLPFPPDNRPQQSAIASGANTSLQCYQDDDSVPVAPILSLETQLITGAADPALPHLKRDLDKALALDMAVAFIQKSGLEALKQQYRDFLARGGRARLLTGDYLDITDPDALQELLDWGGQLDLRVFQVKGGSFHLKAYLFHFAENRGAAYIGSSNLTALALGEGIEWNIRTGSAQTEPTFQQICHSFNQLFHHKQVTPVTPAWLKSYRQRRKIPAISSAGVVPEPALPPVTPHPVQQRALAALEQTRRAGNHAGLVVLATGLGKTWLAAFDSNRPEYRRILFIAHREEILAQAKATFRRIHPNAYFGDFTGKEKWPEADILFASIQTIGQQNHLRHFERDDFDYIVIDEFHHAAAASYQAVLDYFTPQFLLALTATPERSDGRDILTLCQENLVFRCDLFEAIQQDLLCPLHYFGIPDDLDYRQIAWRSSRFDEEALTQATATTRWAEQVYAHYRTWAGQKILAFCCSRRHADFMAQFFQGKGVRAVAVHSGPQSAPRGTSLERLASDELDLICTVDMFNEGVDLPAIDTIMMLRPTESSIIWLQQLGRGLRKCAGKSYLTVIDTIGNHRVFLNGLRALFDLPPGDQALAEIINKIKSQTLELPSGCSVCYDLQAIDILQALLHQNPSADIIGAAYHDFQQRYGQRPTALQLFHMGYNPRSIKKAYGSWSQFVWMRQDLPGLTEQHFKAVQPLLLRLESLPITNAGPLALLLALLSNDAFPDSLDIATLAEAVERIMSRSAILRSELPGTPDIIDFLEQQAIPEWLTGQSPRARIYFHYESRQFGWAGPNLGDSAAALRSIMREIIDWRLAEYIERRKGEPGELITGFRCKVNQTHGRPILHPLDRKKYPDIPTGWHNVRVAGSLYRANFVKIAVNVLKDPQSDANVLGDVIKRMFGEQAGQSGHHLFVRFIPDAEGTLEMIPETTTS
jgi:superfamily II DNA or RNA helicase/HKD family nuclease/uncharacterized protein (DUF1330 family)